MAVIDHFSEEENIDLYDDLDEVQVETEACNPVDISENYVDVFQQQTYSFCKQKSKNTVAELKEENSEIDNFSLYAQLLYLDNEAKRKKKEKEKEDFINVMKESSDLKQNQHVLEEEVKLLKEENAILKQNISSLYKTAKHEIEFKTSLIVELRKELDEYLFRRKAPENGRYRKQVIRKTKYDKPYNDREYDVATNCRTRTKEFPDDFSYNIETTKKSYKSMPEKNDNKPDVSVNNKQWKDAEYVLKTALHKLVDGERGSSETKESQDNTKRQTDPLIEHLQKVLFLAMGKNTNGDNCTQIAKKQQQEKQPEKRTLHKRHNDEMIHHSLSKRFRLSSPVKRLNSQSYHDRENVQLLREDKNGTWLKTRCDAPEKFSSSMVKDAIKLFGYQKMDVPFAVKKRLGLPMVKSSAQSASKNLDSSAKFVSRLLKPCLPDKVCSIELKQSNAAPKITSCTVVNSKISSIITTSNTSGGIVEQVAVPCTVTNAVTCPCMVTNSVTSPLTVANSVTSPLAVANSVTSPYKSTSCIPSSTKFSNVVTSLLAVSNRSFPVVPAPRPEQVDHKRSKTKRKSCRPSLHKRKSHSSENSIEQTCISEKGLNMSMTQNKKAKDKVNLDLILDFGLKMLDDPSEEIGV